MARRCLRRVCRRALRGAEGRGLRAACVAALGRCPLPPLGAERPRFERLRARGAALARPLVSHGWAVQLMTHGRRRPGYFGRANHASSLDDYDPNLAKLGRILPKSLSCRVPSLAARSFRPSSPPSLTEFARLWATSIGWGRCAPRSGIPALLQGVGLLDRDMLGPHDRQRPGRQHCRCSSRIPLVQKRVRCVGESSFRNCHWDNPVRILPVFWGAVWVALA